MRKLKKLLWPYKVTVPIAAPADRHNQPEFWLGENIGAVKHRWNVVYNWDTSDYYFRDQNDLLMFSLKWS